MDEDNDALDKLKARIEQSANDYVRILSLIQIQ